MKSLPQRIMEHAEAMPEATPICPAALLHLGQRAAVGQALSPAWPVQAGSCGSAKGSTCARSSPASGGVRRASKSHPKRFRSSGARRSSRTRLGR